MDFLESATHIYYVKWCISHYRKIGLCPLPTRMDRKGPDLPSYSQFFKGYPVPEEVYEKWNSRNVQLITGTRTPTRSRIIVVDIDGEGSGGVWFELCRRYGYEPSSDWVVHTGGEGVHIYFSLHESVKSCPSGRLWGEWDPAANGGKGDWDKHREIRLLGDNSLVVAPPSTYVGVIDTHKHPYRFDPEFSPSHSELPEIAPRWLLDLPRVNWNRPKQHIPKFVSPQPQRADCNGKLHYPYRDVLEAIGGDKLSLAQSWGLVVNNSSPNCNGWVSCYVPWRETPGRSRPSGSFNVETGCFMDMKTREPVWFFELSVRLGVFLDWKDSVNYHGERYIGKNQS